MRKILMLAAVAALAFTSCMKEDENYKRLKRMEPGINIYNGTMTMQRVAMQSVDVTMRLAIIMAEAYKQDPSIVDPDLTKIMVDDGKVNLFTGLLGEEVTISKIEKGYKLVFKTKTMFNLYWCDGTIEVQTNGKQLMDATAEEPWKVMFGEDYKVLIRNIYGVQELLADVSSVDLYYNQADAYKINVTGFQGNTEERPSIKSNWNTSITLTPPSAGVSLAYRDIKGRRFGLEGTGAGPSCVTFNSTSSTRLSYKVLDGSTINSSDMVAGVVECALTGTNDYDPSYEKGKTASVSWSWPSEAKPPVAILTWNMLTENVTGYVR